MSILLFFALLGFLLGIAAVASNPSPFFAALGLVAAAFTGCGLIILHASTFLSIVVVLIYLGGMLVVFAYACSFSAENFPEGWETSDTKKLFISYGLLFLSGNIMLLPDWSTSLWPVLQEINTFYSFRTDFAGVAFLYEGGGLMLMVAIWALLLTLFAAMEVSRGGARGVLRA